MLKNLLILLLVGLIIVILINANKPIDQLVKIPDAVPSNLLGAEKIKSKQLSRSKVDLQAGEVERLEHELEVMRLELENCFKSLK